MAGEARLGSGILAFLDDLAAAFASCLAASPRAWAALGLGAVAATAWLDVEWLPDVAVVAGCLVAQALPRRVPAAAVLLAVQAAVLTFLSDTILPDWRAVLEIAAPVTAGAVTAAWAVGRERPGRGWIAVAVLGVAAALVAKDLGEERSPAWQAVVSAAAAAAVVAAATPLRWLGCALLAATLAVTHSRYWALAPFDALESVGAALLITTVASAARRCVLRETLAGEAASARCVTAVRRRPLAAALLGATLVCNIDPLGRWLIDLTASATEFVPDDAGRLGGPLLTLWPCGWLLVPLLAAHVGALDGLASAIRRASLTAVAAAGVSSVASLLWEVEFGSAAGGGVIDSAWVQAEVLDAARYGIVLIAAAIYTWGTVGRRPGSSFGTADAVAFAAAVGALVAPLMVEAENLLETLVFEVVLGIAVHRIAMTRVRLATVVFGAAVTAVFVTAAAALRSTSGTWLLAVAVVTSTALVRLVLFVSILRRIRSLTPVPDDHPILADFATDLRSAAARPTS